MTNSTSVVASNAAGIKSGREWRMHSHYNPECAPITSPLGQQGIMRHFLRKNRELPAEHWKMLGFIYDQTVNWGIAERRFTHKFIEKGDALTDGIGIKRSQSKLIISELQTIGAIFVDRTNQHIEGMLIRPNLDWEARSVRPKRVKASDQPPEPTPPPSDALLSAADEVESVMRQVFMDNYPVALWTPWTADQRSEFAAGILENWPADDIARLHTFVGWVVTEWMKIEFAGFAADRITHPDIDSFLRHSAMLFMSFQSHEDHRWLLDHYRAILMRTGT